MTFVGLTNVTPANVTPLDGGHKRRRGIRRLGRVFRVRVCNRTDARRTGARSRRRVTQLDRPRGGRGAGARLAKGPAVAQKRTVAAMTDQNAGNSDQGAGEQQPPTFLGYRAFAALENYPASESLITNGFAECEVVLKLLDAALGAAYGSPPEHWFPNNIAATALQTRAFNGLQAAAHLCALGFYSEARGTLRGVYEAAGLARTLAKRVCCWGRLAVRPQVRRNGGPWPPSVIRAVGAALPNPYRDGREPCQ
jgi:hypothetical protein